MEGGVMNGGRSDEWREERKHERQLKDLWMNEWIKIERLAFE